MSCKQETVGLIAGMGNILHVRGSSNPQAGPFSDTTYGIAMPVA